MPTAARRCARAVIEYQGTAFSGSQVQPQARTVQGELEAALNRLTGERVRVRLAGRTDAGVHATGQVAALCLLAGRGPTDWRALRRRLNAALPSDVAVRSLRAVAADFDPRRDAIARVYSYRIRMNGESRPLDRHRTLEIGDALDVSAMRAAAAGLVGERDFAALGGESGGTTVRRIMAITVRRTGPLVVISVTADAFLRGMVRRIVAVLLEAGRGRLAPDEVEALTSGAGRALHGRAAPARGLTLERVIYPARPRGRAGDDLARTTNRRAKT